MKTSKFDLTKVVNASRIILKIFKYDKCTPEELGIVEILKGTNISINELKCLITNVILNAEDYKYPHFYLPTKKLATSYFSKKTDEMPINS